MPRQNINIQLKNWIGKNSQLLLGAKGWKQIARILKEHGINATAREYYDILYPEKIIDCEHSTFVSLSVGYRTCSKGCECYKRRISESVKQAKSNYTDEDRAKILTKRKNTVFEKYGVGNVSNIPGVVEKIQQTKTANHGDKNYNNRTQAAATLFERTGVTNPMHLPEVVVKVNINKDHCEIAAKTQVTKFNKYKNATFNNPSKRKQTCIQKYGVDNPAKSQQIKEQLSKRLREKFVARHCAKYNVIPGFRALNYSPGKKNIWYCSKCGHRLDGIVDSGKFTRCLNCNPLSVSKPELDLREFISGLGVEVVTNDRTIISPHELDIVVPSKKIAIEFCGTYWHAEQKGKGKFYHQSKLLRCRDAGYTLITIFSDIWETKPDLVKSRLTSIFGASPIKLNARSCNIRQISPKECRQFLEDTHLQGDTRAAVRLGLCYNNKIVAVMTFGKSRFETNTQELIRFSTLPMYSIRGAASKLFLNYLRNYSPSKVVSYSDNSWGLTDFYSRLGFVCESIGAPGYSYINLCSSDRTRINRLNFQKHKIVKKFNVVNASKTEYEIMLENQFDRVWDTGHARWVWNQKS